MSIDKTKQNSIYTDCVNADSVLEKSLQIQARAAEHGFDWPDIAPVFDKVLEELNELKHEVEIQQSNRSEGLEQQEAIAAEFGDLLFSCLNLSRFIDVKPSDALERTNAKFVSRFQFIERILQEQGRNIGEVSLTQLDHLWDQAKRQENKSV